MEGHLAGHQRVKSARLRGEQYSNIYESIVTYEGQDFHDEEKVCSQVVIKDFDSMMNHLRLHLHTLGIELVLGTFYFKINSHNEYTLLFATNLKTAIMHNPNLFGNHIEV